MRNYFSRTGIPCLKNAILLVKLTLQSGQMTIEQEEFLLSHNSYLASSIFLYFEEKYFIFDFSELLKLILREGLRVVWEFSFGFWS